MKWGSNILRADDGTLGNKCRSWMTALAILSALGAMPQSGWAAGPWYVDPAGNNANDCLSPATACLTIGAAITKASPADTVNVAAGTYVEAISITKPLTVRGATADANKNGYPVPAGYAWDDAVESIIMHPNPNVAYNAVVDIRDTDDVTFEGFVVQELSAVGNNSTSLIRVYANTRQIRDIVVRNNVIGPNTHTTLQDGTRGRMGLYIVNHPYSGDYGVVDSAFSGNKIFDAQGNGNNVFLWSSYYAYGAPYPASMSGTVIEDNEIYGSRRSGIESAGGYSDLTIRNNRIYGNASTVAGAPYSDYLKYGHGVMLIRGASDKLGDAAHAYGPVDLTIQDNEIYGNEKSGIYMGARNTNYLITGNLIEDNGWNGILLDLEERHWNNTFEPPPVPINKYAIYDGTTNIVVSDNSVAGNGTASVPGNDYAIQVNGAPTNGFVLDASGNWWGTNAPSGVAGAVSASVDYTPWLDDGTDTGGSGGFQGDFAVLDVDDNSPQSGSVGRIQEGVNLVSGSTVNVAAGTYTEQVRIDKSLDLVGAGETTTTIEAPPKASRVTQNANHGFGLRTYDYLVGVFGSGTETVNISGFTLDGNMDAKSSGSPVPPATAFRSQQLTFFNSNGTIADNTLIDWQAPASFGAQYVAALVSGSITPVAVDIRSNVVIGYQKGGIVAFGSAAVVTTIEGNVVTGAGPIASTAQNGIQISNGAVGSIVNNQVTGNYYTGSGWCASGILVFSNGVTVQNNTLNGSLCDLLVQSNGNTISGNVIDPAADWPFSIIGNNNTVSNNVVTGSPGVGVYNDGTGNSYTCNRITGNVGGFYFDSYSGAGTPNTVNNNSIFDNGVGVDASAITGPPDIDATGNWWGCVSGPGNPGCDTIAGSVDASAAASFVPACVPCSADAQCDDGLFCSGEETCANGSCAAPSGDPCSGGSECADSCNESAGNCHDLSGTPCTDDGNVCTTNACDGGGTCAANSNTLPCSDGLYCTGADTCAGGSCSQHTGDPCSGGSECADACNESADNCSDLAGTLCTDDGNVCTTNACNGSGACTATNNTAACNDAVFCNGADTCSAGACTTHAGNPCPGPDGDGNCAESCDEPGDTCTAADTNGSACDDALFCNGADACSAGTCATHAGNPCAAGPECADACNESVDNCNDLAGTLCTDDGNVCTTNACNGGGACAATNNALPCDDGARCTLDDTCSGGTCSGADSQLAELCPWSLVVRESVGNDSIKTGQLSLVDGDVCSSRLLLGILSATDGSVVATDTTGPGVIRIAQDVAVTGDIVSGGGGAKGKPNSVKLPYTNVVSLNGGTVTAKNDSSGDYDLSGDHPLVATCSAARGSYASATAYLATLDSDLDAGAVSLDAGETATLVAPNPGTVNVIDVDYVRGAANTTLRLDGGGNPATVVVLRVAGGLEIRNNSAISLIGGLTPDRVLINVLGRKCDIGNTCQGAGTLLCSAARIRVDFDTTWTGAWYAGARLLSVGDRVEMTYDPFVAF